MSKTLNTIQIFARIGKVISMVVSIVCLVGAIGCLIGVVSLGVGFTDVIKLGGITIHGLIAEGTEINTATMYASCTVGLIMCVGEYILAKLTWRYFNHELQTGTPFTFEGAKELKRVGIHNVWIPIVTMIIASVAYQLFKQFMGSVAPMDLDTFGSIGLGIAMIVVSVIFKYGAEQQELKATDSLVLE